MQRIVPIEIDPVAIKTADGKERKFLLSAGGMNRLKARFGVKTMQELFAVDESATATILWEALLEKDGLSEDNFYDLLPFNPAVIARAVAMLLGASFPDPPKADLMATSQTAVN